MISLNTRVYIGNRSSIGTFIHRNEVINTFLKQFREALVIVISIFHAIQKLIVLKCYDEL